jgi:hypothetical protein
MQGAALYARATLYYFIGYALLGLRCVIPAYFALHGLRCVSPSGYALIGLRFPFVVTDYACTGDTVHDTGLADMDIGITPRRS